jgi:hypothetical protein
MQITEAAKAPERLDDGGNLRAGKQDTRLLLTSDKSSAYTYKMALVRAVTEYNAPRHRHDIDQIRLTLKGESTFGRHAPPLPEGWVGYFPEGVSYGPQVRKPGTLEIQCQFGGASGRAYIGATERKAAIAALSAKGQFDGGVYTWLDEAGKRHNQDASEAVWEKITGRKLEYPPGRYADIVAMDPASFKWVDQGGGVTCKWLGAFTERGTRTGFIRLDKGATYQGGKFEAPELLFLISGSVTCRDKTYGPDSAFGFDRGEGPVALAATAPSEFFGIQLSIF